MSGARNWQNSTFENRPDIATNANKQKKNPEGKRIKIHLWGRLLGSVSQNS